jgi:hypothetical protein
VTGPDIRLGITAVDLGASRLVRGIADALRALNSVQAQQDLKHRLELPALPSLMNRTDSEEYRKPHEHGLPRFEQSEKQKFVLPGISQGHRMRLREDSSARHKRGYGKLRRLLASHFRVAVSRLQLETRLLSLHGVVN